MKASPGCGGLTTFGILGSGLLEVFLQLVEGIELRCFGSEVIVELRQLFSLNGVDLDLDLSLLAFVVASFQGAFESGLFAGGQAFEGLIQTVEHGFGAELVAHAFLGVDHFTVDFGGQVDVGVVALGGRTVHTHEGAETLAPGLPDGC